MEYKHTFTVFTATYNRANRILGVYNSLKGQTFKDFEWLVIDDGSTDNTEELIKEWQQNSEFPIRYLKKENGGKHTAYNFGIPKARGEFLLTLDSDDTCVPEALQVFYEAWQGIPDKERFSAVTANCFDENGDLIGTPYPRDFLDSDSIELRYIHKVKGEKWGFQKTEIMLKYPFPEPDGLKLIPENIVWDAISLDYKTRFINRNLRQYITGEDSYTRAIPQKYAYPSVLSKVSTLNNCIGYFNKSPLEFLKTSVHYVRFSLHSNSKLFYNLNNSLAKFLVFLSLPLGFIVFMKDRMVYKD